MQKKTLIDFARKFDFNVESQFANVKLQSLATKSIRAIKGKQKVRKCVLVCKLKSGIDMIACHYPDVRNFYTLIDLEYLINKGLKEEGYNFEISVYEFI